MRKQGTKNLTWVQRLQIEALFKANMHKKDIAKQVGVCLRTIQRELRRGEYEHTIKQDNFWWKAPKYKKVKRYSAQIAHDKYKFNNTAKGRPLKVGNDYDFINYINNRVKNERITAHAVWGEMQYKEMPFETRIAKQRYTTIYDLDFLKISKWQNAKRNTKSQQSSV